jgi:anti-sigma factor ChrR (cupin superfamily)
MHKIQRALDFERLAKACWPRKYSLITTPRVKPFILKDIFNIASRQHELPWEPFGDGVEIFWIYRNGGEGSAAALLKYQPGGRISLHQHLGFEHIIVLSGSQTDENGHLETGSLMVHQPGTSHSIVSEEGCIVLAVYEKRVAFVPQEQ